MQAYGGRFDDGTVPFVMRDGLGSEIFKEFEKFDYQFGNEKEPLVIFMCLKGQREKSWQITFKARNLWTFSQ